MWVSVRRKFLGKAIDLLAKLCLHGGHLPYGTVPDHAEGLRKGAGREPGSHIR